jgi:signal transduction histidine kinase
MPPHNAQPGRLSPIRCASSTIPGHSTTLPTRNALYATAITVGSAANEAREALRSIEQTSRGALLEMRSMLGVLRSAAAEPLPRQPVPDLAELRELADRAIAAGVAVDLDVTGSGNPPAGVTLAVYRIVQEALTNVVKHAAPARCAVRVEIGAESVHVIDDGTRLAGTGGGHGLVGMRERVTMYDGEFAAGPRPTGGFAITARLPYEKGEPG